jgi:NAD(P)-dependent dehydrogenase (short-subunit alcohol dehydrogenase family)
MSIKKLFDLTGKVALITGGSRGLGLQIGEALGEMGAKLAITARKTDELEAARALLAAQRIEALPIACDLSKPEAIEPMVHKALAHYGRIDILVNNAGAIRGGDFLTIPDEQWAGDWSLKILGYVRMARAVFPMMQAQGGGRIVNIVGAAARNPTAGYLTGGIANSGLINFSKGLADLGAPSNILVTAVSPAATATARWESLIAQQAASAGKTVEAQRAEAASHYPLKRIATPEDIADLVCFLVSARASFITGVCITVDGGATRGVYL